MTTKFDMIRDINGYNGFGLRFADDKYSTVLATGVAQSLTIPSSYPKWLAIFSYEPGDRIYVANNATAEVATSPFSTTTSEINPVARLVRAGDVLSFITPNTSAEVGVTLYALE